MTPWNWSAFRGSADALKYLRRDLPALDRIIARTPQRRVAVQAGGNLGLYPKRLAEMFATVYTFEPAADLFAMLMHNAPEANIVKFQAAVGEARRTVGVSRARRDGSSKPAHEGITHVYGDGPIPTLRVDDLGLGVCDLICLDVEGSELNAVRGAAETIERCRPVLAVEVNKNQGFVGVAEEFLRDTIKSLGYRFIERLESDEVYVPAEWSMEAVA